MLHVRGLLLIPLLVGLLLVGCGDGAGAGGKALVPEGEPLVQTRPGGFIVTGEVRNMAQRPYSGALQVLLKDGAGKIVGTASGAVNDVPPGGTAPYTLMGLAPTAPHERVEVTVTGVPA